MIVVAPRPIASVSTAMSVKPGLRRIWRSAYRKSCPARSITDQPHARRTSSLIRPTLPKARWAASRSSSSSASRSMWARSSRSRSSSFLRRPNILHLLSSFLLGRHHASDRDGELVPSRLLRRKLLASRRGEPVILEFAIAILSLLPFARDPALLFQAMQRGVERAMLHLQDVVRGALDVLGDFMAM